MAHLDFDNNVFETMTEKDFEKIDRTVEEYWRCKREAAEKRMLDDYMKREREWRAADAIKPTGINQQFLWEEHKKEREFNENKQCKKRRKLYEFVSTMK